MLCAADTTRGARVHFSFDSERMLPSSSDVQKVGLCVGVVAESCAGLVGDLQWHRTCAAVNSAGCVGCGCAASGTHTARQRADG